MDKGKLSVPLSSQSAIDVGYPSDSCCLLQDVVEGSDKNFTCSKDTTTQCSGRRPSKINS
jgi:hypothetical protein